MHLKSLITCLVLLVSIFATVFADNDVNADICLLRKDVPCLHVPKCADGKVTINRYWLTNAPYPQLLAARQRTITDLCYNTDGIVVHEHAAEKYIKSPWSKCNSAVWQQSDVVEMFIYPTGNVYDVPKFYYEIDVTPTKAVFGSLIYNNKGNVTNCDGCAQKSIELPCTGANTFPDHKFTHSVDITETAYRTTRFIPFDMFPQKMRKSKIWRANFYRYDYPDGFAKKYELSGWSPTYSPSFHEPARFGILVFDF